MICSIYSFVCIRDRGKKCRASYATFDTKGAWHLNRHWCEHMCPSSYEIKLQFFRICGCWHNSADSIKKGFVDFCGFMAVNHRALK